jgi:Leucine-rich repeat (LRR) protein
MKLYKSLKAALKERASVRALKLTLEEHFPPELEAFPHLTELYLEGDCQTLPSHHLHWPELKVLQLKFPRWQGDLTPLFALPMLENLKLLQTPLDKLRLPLGEIPAIKILTIKDCQLRALPEEISALSSLTELHLPQNLLQELPASFRELQQLKRINLDHNQFRHFPDVLGQMPRVSHLSIDGNLFDENEINRIQRQYHISIK